MQRAQPNVRLFAPNMIRCRTVTQTKHGFAPDSSLQHSSNMLAMADWQQLKKRSSLPNPITP